MRIAVASSVLSKRWRNIETSWPDMVKKFEKPVRTGETFAEYQSSAKAEKDLKKGSAGCFVGGELIEGRRVAGAVRNRCLLTLDADAASMEDWDMVTLMTSCAVIAYTTHSHSPKTPRLRWIIPLAYPVSPEEYVAIARKEADTLGILETLDPTTFQPSRAMFNPTCAQDGEYKCFVQDGPFLDPGEVLAAYGPDEAWKDSSLWPMSSKEAVIQRKTADKQGDPTLKPGLIGAFCRCYDIDTAISKFLPGVYTPCALPGRYTYAKGSTAAGLVVYDDGQFAFSNHATDPASGKLCNAFDLVRIHLYGDQDEDAAPDTPMSRRPSFLAMTELVENDLEVKRLLHKERMDLARTDFDSPQDDEHWEDRLDTSKGKVLSNVHNVHLIICNDPRLKGCVAYNALKVRLVALHDLPWRKVMDPVNGDTWADSDDTRLFQFLEEEYGVTGENKIRNGLLNAANDNIIHPIKNYLEGLTWDGVPRLGTLLVDYLGAEDTAYTRAVTRKTFMAAVARIFEPGCKFDYVLVLAGPQGRGKSTLVAKMSNGWYTDSLAGIGTKEAYENIQGYWLVELGELAAMRKIEIETIKNFISKQVDSYRAAYGRRVEDHPRQCIFIGTTNSTAFLRDDTGNRRFWPVRLGETAPKLTVWGDLTQQTIDQLWAEAVTLYREGERLTLPPELAESAQEQQREFTEDDPRRGLVEIYLDTLLPAEWEGWDIGRRQGWFSEDGSMRAVGTVRRNFVCAAEIWAECFGNDLRKFPRQDRGEVIAILHQLPDWKEEPKRQRCGVYGRQTRFRRVT